MSEDINEYILTYSFGVEPIGVIKANQKVIDMLLSGEAELAGAYKVDGEHMELISVSVVPLPLMKRTTYLEE